MPRVLYRFARDLRLEDHAGLAAATSFGEIVPVLILDPLLVRRVTRSARRAAFFCAAVRALQAALRERGAHLIVRRGPLVQTALALVRETQAMGMVWSATYDAQSIALERQLQSSLEERGHVALSVHDAPAIPPEETAIQKTSAGEGYRALVPYIETWRGLEVATHEAPLLMRFADPGAQTEPLPDEHELHTQPTQGLCGQRAALERLRSFLDSDALTYIAALTAPAQNRTSQLSAHLSFGTIAARTVVRETKARLDDPFLLAEEKASLRRFLRSLAQRDFFLQLAWFHPDFANEPLQVKMRDFRFAQTHAQLDAWKEGRTGYPLVDAGIRQLRATGWMHPRVRAIAASFLCFDLGVDYRIGEREWDEQLMEDEPALSLGNWQWVAGVGADLAAYPRIYNPVKQARRFDPAGTYVRTWIPELRHRASVFATGPVRSMELPLFGEASYPQPVLDHDSAAREFLARYVSTVQPESVRRSNH